MPGNAEAAERRFCGVGAWVWGGCREAPREIEERRKTSTAGKPAVAPSVSGMGCVRVFWLGAVCFLYNDNRTEAV
jgi:hypothetical protein